MTEDRVLTFLEDGDIRQFYVRIHRFCSGCNVKIPDGERCDPCEALWVEDERKLDEMAEAERRYKDSDAWDRAQEEHE